ncbi:MAG: hypothetical protein CFH21_00141 [Alphaproteobacteria bacterium MarineAlpha5_Bin11]|nr:hypothetical protein [Pelagibacteraceae bacterium]PPR44893.1 MAG: hypothetical protein CFH21_00141 [Alphaproteobacteria bacterium MarineAlpha5_Bin11]PPR51851.1 MAG: hypothetical protein CFH20_00269 [Alphaproteobacteria bacterium MarineAlpha5_Bin10]|tara:strand:+ start:296 stop:1294 length:999 start_codon:yes stop_codon:yes gene_type:complete
MKIKNFEVDKYIQTLSPARNPILLYGPDEGLAYNRSKKIQSVFLKNSEKKDSFVIFDFKNDDVNKIIQAVQEQSMFVNNEVIKIINVGEKILGIIDKLLIKESNKLIVLIAGELGPKSKLRSFFEKDPQGLIIPCYKTDSKELRRAIIQFGVNNKLKIEDGAISYLVEILGDSYQIIQNELNKLTLLDENVISYELIKNLISGSGSFAHDDIIFKCLSGNINFFGSFSINKINNMEEAVFLLSKIKNLLFIFGETMTSCDREGLDSAVDYHMPKYLFKKKETFKSIVRKNNHKNIADSLRIISQVELKMRENQAIFRPILHRGMLNIAQNMR